ncbi:MAG: efflux RND transporter permease subunit [Flavobacteriales bacterium]|nr:efflux RND transporter permease subunit [Flavobacteriales bacterium]
MSSVLLFFAFGSVKQALIIFSAVPLAAVGGVFALSIRSLDFSISAGIGFIALFGVAVLNGIVLISYFDQLERSRDAALDDGSGITDDEKAERITERVISGTLARLRPVLATAAVASLGFLPMALSNSEGSEVQRPLATVVIGGLISSTLLTLVVLPVLYHLVYTRRRKRSSGTSATVVPALLLLLFVGTSAQAQVLPLDSAVSRALRTHPTITAAELNVQQQEVLRRTAFQLNPINAQYQHGQINSGYARDFNLQATTGIDFLPVMHQRAAYLKESLRLAEADQLTTRSVVKESAGGAYLQWTMAAEQIALLKRLDTIYSRLATYADRKFEVGQTGRLEKVSAQSSADQIAIELRRAEGDLAVYQAELERWTGGLNGALPDTNSMTLLAHAPDPDVGMDPVLLQEQQRVALAEKAWKLERSQWAPSLQGGGFYQSLDGLSPFSGYLMVHRCPLPGSGGQGVRTKAARLRSEIAQQQFEDVRRTRSTELVRTRTRLVQLRENLAYYEGTGTALASTLRGDAERAYLNGDVGYMEFIQGVDRSYRIDSEHLRTRFELALTLLHLKSLLGQ